MRERLPSLYRFSALTQIVFSDRGFGAP